MEFMPYNAPLVVLFALRAGVRPARLMIADASWISRFLIGHESSFLHKKIFFRLPPTVPVA